MALSSVETKQTQTRDLQMYLTCTDRPSRNERLFPVSQPIKNSGSAVFFLSVHIQEYGNKMECVFLFYKVLLLLSETDLDGTRYDKVPWLRPTDSHSG